MSHVIQVGQWLFEIKQVRAIKAKEFGLPYTATAWITVTNGKPTIEGLISKDDKKLTRQDFKDIEQFLTITGFKNTDWQRFNNVGKKRITKKVL